MSQEEPLLESAKKVEEEKASAESKPENKKVFEATT